MRYATTDKRIREVVREAARRVYIDERPPHNEIVVDDDAVYLNGSDPNYSLETGYWTVARHRGWTIRVRPATYGERLAGYRQTLIVFKHDER